MLRLARSFHGILPILAAVAALFLLAPPVSAADVVPNDVKIPGTQPTPVDNPPNITSVGNCGCHSFTGDVEPAGVPVFGWTGGMMANAGRDPLFWSTVAIAEQDFLPGSGGVGDLCLHCHSVKGWVEGRSTPTNGSGLDPATDGEGIMCEFCHLLTNPDQANTIPNPPEGSYVEEQHSPFTAYDPVTGQGWYGGAEYVLNSGGTRLGPYTDTNAKHPAIPSAFHRDARLCGTCHDVSNPAVGDLAPNHGAFAPLPGGFSGVPGSPVEDKAAFNNPPASYGIVERTFSEYISSAFDTLAVQDFATLPAELQVVGGAPQRAYEAARWGTCSSSGDFCNFDANCSTGQTCVTTSANYQDGQVRLYTCQTCHMAATGGDGATQGRPKPYMGQIRPDLPKHDQTGFSHWIQDVVQYQDANGTLVFGGGLTSDQISAMNAAKARGTAHLQSAARLELSQVGNDLQVKVINLTAHKLPSGYPEGRRIWIEVTWKDGGGAEIGAAGAYGPIGNVIADLDGDLFDVQSILDPSSTKIYQAKPGMTPDWAAALISLGYPTGMVLEWNRADNSPLMTLGELAAEAGPDPEPTFHFVLNNSIYQDDRVPPYGFEYDVAYPRNALPVPADQYGGAGPGSVYNHFDLVDYDIPASAESAEVRLLYQSTSWEYIQFLWLQNYGSDPAPPAGDPFLGNEGLHLLDAWLNTQMSPPVTMASATIPVAPVALNAPGGASDPTQPEMMVTSFVAGELTLTYDPACDATGHTIHYGPLAAVSSYGWAAADCSLDASGSGTFVPDPAVGDSLFFVLAGHNDSWEGTYGQNSLGAERPASAAAGVCARAQSLTPVCE